MNNTHWDGHHHKIHMSALGGFKHYLLNALVDLTIVWLMPQFVGTSTYYVPELHQ
jgi:hypothetical protein